MDKKTEENKLRDLTPEKDAKGGARIERAPNPLINPENTKSGADPAGSLSGSDKGSR